MIFSDDIMLVPSLLRFNEQDFPILLGSNLSIFPLTITDNEVLFVSGYGCFMIRLNATEETNGILHSLHHDV